MNSNDHTEIEVKFSNVSLTDVREHLRRTGATLKTDLRLMRRAVFGSESNSDMTCTYGRVRDEGDVVTMSAKFSAVNGEITSQKEIMVTVDDFENAVSLLKAFGLSMTDYQENKRETWSYDDGTLVELESWPELPDYLEIEGPSVDALKRVASFLLLDWDTHTTDSTDKLYQQYHKLTPEELRLRMTDLRFDNITKL